MEKLNIKQWAEEDRPREKMEKLGTEALSDAELLAILIGKGSAKEDAVSLMKRILADCKNNLNTLGKMQGHFYPGSLRTGKTPSDGIAGRASRLRYSHPHLQPHAPHYAGSRCGGVLGVTHESALSSHQENTNLAWWYHRDRRRYPHHHEGGRPCQRHHPRRLPQPPFR